MPARDQTYTEVVLRSDPLPGVRYVTGATVYDEAFCEGRLVSRYRSPAGQVWPEMHLTPERLQAAIHQGPLEVLSLGIEGEELVADWQWLGAEQVPDASGLRVGLGGSRQVVITLRHAQRPVEVRVCTRLDGSPWLVRWLEITNRGERATAISSVAPLAGRLWAHRYDEHLPLGATSPFALAYHHGTTWGREGDLWWEPLRAGTVTFDGGRNGKSGWSRPAFWARDLANGQTFVAELAWSGNWQFDMQCRLESRREGQLSFALGMAPVAGEMLRVLLPSETARTPAVHFGLFQEDEDHIVQALHRHVRHTVMPRAPQGREVEIEANHRGYLCDRENEPDLLADIDVAALVGAELYVVDAGWFGREPNHWWLNVGDWHAGSWLANGLEPVVAHAHARGLRFGLWVEAEAAGENSTLREQHPCWLLRRRGELVANGRALDLSQPEVAAWVESEIGRLIDQYGLDMFRLDHNHSMGLGGTREQEGFIENTLWLYYEALYALFDHLHARFPEVVFQNCAGGGGRLDLGILQRFHNTELSDWMRQPRAMHIANGLTMALPPEIGLRTFGTEVGEHALDADLDSQLRYACLFRPILRGIAPSVAELYPYLQERLAHHLGLYKQFLRPLMRDSLVFHHTPWLRMGPPAWCVFEVADAGGRQAAVTLFRLAAAEPTTYQLVPRGLDRGRTYRVTFDNTGQAVELPGHTLLNEGLIIRLLNPFSSEMLLFQAVD